MHPIVVLTVLAAVILVGSAIATGVEAAILTVSPIQVHTLTQQRVPGSRALERIKARPGRALALLVVANNLCNISGSMALGSHADGVFHHGYGGAAGLVAFNVVFTLLVILFAEILPKAIGNSFAMPISLVSARVLLLAERLTLPLLLLLVLFNGSVSRLIPLYAVGVFLSFTLSQAGMVVHWWRQRGAAWWSKAAVNGVGALVTAVVTVVLLFSKFTHGAWLVVVAIPLLVSLFLAIKRHYQTVSKRLRLAADKRLSLPPAPGQGGVPVVLLVGQLHRGSFEAVRYARTIAKELVAVHVDLGLGQAAAFQEQWQRQLPEIPLVVLESPYRSLIDPVLRFVQGFEAEHRTSRDRFCTVVLPVFVTRHRWENLLHNQSTIALRSALRAQGTRVVTTVGFYL